jgi:phenylalanyl-tRNA synthetase alpha chain
MSDMGLRVCATHSIKGIEARKSFNPFFILSHRSPISHTMNELDTLVESARQSFVQALTPADLENAKALFLGKAGRITELMKGMAALSVEDKKTRGAAINLAKQAIEAALTAPPGAGRCRVASATQSRSLDVTLPGRSANMGGLHPVSLTLERVEQHFWLHGL